VAVDTPYTAPLRRMIKRRSDEVARVHLGVVHCSTSSGPRCGPPRRKSSSAASGSLERLLADHGGDLRQWSQELHEGRCLGSSGRIVGVYSPTIRAGSINC